LVEFGGLGGIEEIMKTIEEFVKENPVGFCGLVLIGFLVGLAGAALWGNNVGHTEVWENFQSIESDFFLHLGDSIDETIFEMLG
jgi:hypothetical protein